MNKIVIWRCLMDKKIAKEHLQRIYLIKKNIKTLEDQLMEIDTKIKGGAINYSEKVQTSGRGSTESLMCIAVDLQYKDRKSTRLNSSHANMSYAVFCLTRKTTRR